MTPEPRSIHGPRHDPAEIDVDLDDELQFHLEMRIAELRATGLSPAEARQEALRRFGNLEEARAYCRSLDQSRARQVRYREMLSGWRQDLGFAARQLLRHRGFTLIAVLTLALGIGANTAIFSVVHKLLIDPLPFAAGDRIVALMQTGAQNRLLMAPAIEEVDAWRARAHLLETIEPFREDEFLLTLGTDRETVNGGLISATALGFLDVRPILGRGFLAEECLPGGPAVVLLSYGVWQRRFGGSPEVLGQAVSINGKPHQIIGVMPRDFDLPFMNSASRRQIWLPLLPGPAKSRVQAMARLRPEVTAAEASKELASIQTSPQDPEPAGVGEFQPRAIRPQDLLGEEMRDTVLVLFGVVGVVLLIACSNVANLLLVRASTRQREFALRAALGAGRGRLIRQLLTESLCLALIGGAVGLLLAWRGLELIIHLRPERLSRLDEVRLEPIALAWSLGLSLLTGVLFGLAPAFFATRRNLAESLKGSAGGAGAHRASGRMRGFLVTLEVALSVTLLVGAGLLIRSMARLQQVDVGFNPAGLLNVPIVIPEDQSPSRERLSAIRQQLVERIDALPGVAAVTLASSVPPQSGIAFGELELDGRVLEAGEKTSMVGYSLVQPNFFSVFGLPIREGRGFDAGSGSSLVVINQSMARRYWPGKSAVGQRFRMSPSSDWQTVIGITADVQVPGRQTPVDGLQVYSLLGGSVEEPGVDLVIKLSTDPAAVVPLINREVGVVDPLIRVRSINTVRSLLDGALAGTRFNRTLFSTFALLALALSAIGLYGVIAYSVSQRTREIGVRVALGAGTPAVIRLVVGQGLRLTALGVVLGLALTIGGTRAMRGMLYQVDPLDPMTILAVVLLLAAVAVAASYIPARRAARVDPVVALKSD